MTISLWYKEKQIIEIGEPVPRIDELVYLELEALQGFFKVYKVVHSYRVIQSEVHGKLLELRVEVHLVRL